MRTSILTPSALLLVALGAGYDTPRAAAAVGPVIERWPSVAGNCPGGTGLVRPAGADAAADRNHDGYACMRLGISISGDTLRFEVDNDASGARGATPGDAVWDGLYRGM
jgi:hypothetical protein